MAISIEYQGQKLSVDFAELPQNANTSYLFGLPQVKPRPLCTGMGKCGRCKIKYLSPAPELTPLEKVLLTQEEQKNNFRLACKHPLEDNIHIAILDDLQQNATNFALHLPENMTKNLSGETAVLFIDLGTTSIDFEVRSEQKLFTQGKILNPQMFAGADVMARLYYEHFIEKQKPSRLQQILLQYFQKIYAKLENAHILIKEIYLAANPAMTALFSGESTKGLLEAPYYLENKGNKYYHFKKLPPVYIPPQLSAFIGADALAGLAYILQAYPDCNNFLLADLGTNGEFIYYHDGKIYGASVPLGPALEGVGMRCGSAVHGEGENIILSFALNPFGLSYSCKGKAEFICGAAYLSLLNILLSTNCINRQGLFQNPKSGQAVTPLGKKILANFKEVNSEKRLYVTENLYCCAEDIENILKVKAAFSSAVELFLQKNAIEKIFLSGSLSNHIPLDILENLGFLPRNSKAKTSIIGNSSLKGLFSYYTEKNLVSKIEKLSEQAVILDLTSQNEYNALYINNMHF